LNSRFFQKNKKGDGDKGKGRVSSPYSRVQGGKRREKNSGTPSKRKRDSKFSGKKKKKKKKEKKNPCLSAGGKGKKKGELKKGKVARLAA